jgi:hypothetical protein
VTTTATTSATVTTTGAGGQGTTTTTTATTGAGGTGGGSGGRGGTGGTGMAGGGGSKDGGAPKDGGSDATPPGEGGAMCTPTNEVPNAMTGYTRTGWGGQWTPMCNFNTGNGKCADVLPKNAFDGMRTRTTLGDTHLSTGNTAEMIGDTFTFDMHACHTIKTVEFYCGDPPMNSGFDPRDYPGQVEVSVSSDCTTAANGDISGTFTPFTPALFGNEPLVNNQGCSKSSCPGPFVITFPAGTTARCVKMRLTKILAAGGGVWWAIDELYVK